MNMEQLQIERRSASFQLDDGNTLVGLAARFNSWTTIATRQGNFQEQIAPGAFNNLANCNVRCLVNHDPNQLLGTTQAGNVELRQTDDGLAFSVRLLPTQLSKDVRTLVKNNVMTGCSFGWDARTATDTWDGDKRTLTGIPDLLDISICTYPAYNETSVDVRSKVIVAIPELWKYALAIRKMQMTA